MNRSILAVAVWLAVGLGCGPGADGDDPSDPILPLEGMWEVVDREISRAFCDGSASNEPITDVIHVLYIRHLRDRLYLSYGRRNGPSIRWGVTGIRCPVDEQGRWECYAVTIDQDVGVRRAQRELVVTGQILDVSDMMHIMWRRESSCLGDGCRRDYCVIMEHSVVQHIPENRHDPD